MSDEHDSWLSGIGIDVSGILGSVQETATAVMEDVKSAGAAAWEQAQGAATAVMDAPPPAPKPAAAPAPKPAAPAGPASNNGSAGLSLKGSVGAGGKNNPDDVKAVQSALNIAADGNCSPATIEAIKGFQKSLGHKKPDGRIDVGGPTARALAGRGGGAAAPSAPPPVPDGLPPAERVSVSEDEEEGFFDSLKNKVGEKIDEAKGAVQDLGGKVVDGATDLGSKVADGAKGLGVDGGAKNFLLPDSLGGEITFKEKSLGKKSLGRYFELEAKVGGSVKFGGAQAGPDKPSKIELEKGVSEFVESLWAEAVANFKAETGAGLKGNPKEKKISLGGAVTLKTSLGPLNLEAVPVEISLVEFDVKKRELSGPKVAIGGAGNLAGKRTIKGVELELALAVSIGGEATPDYPNIALWIVENVLTDAATQVIMEAGLVLVAVGSVAGLARGLAIAVEEKQIRGELERGRNDFETAMVRVMRGEDPGSGSWAATAGAEAGKRVFKEAMERAKKKFPEMNEMEIRDVAINACRPSTSMDAAVKAKVTEVIGGAMWSKWIDGHHGITTFLGDAKRVCMQCFATGPISSDDPRLQEWKDKSDLPDFMT
jgi:hypothetical protein